MTACVWKYVLPMPSITGRSFVRMPAAVEPLSVAFQDDSLVVWVRVQSEAPHPDEMSEGPRRFIITNTGPAIDLPAGARFLGTVTTPNGIVWHIWDGDAEAP